MPKGVYKKTKEQREKIGNKLRGRKLSEETKNRISQAMKGKIPVTAFKKGHIVSEEMREKIRLANYKKRNPNNRSVVEAHYILKKKIGRKLLKTEVAHHIDGDYTNNNPKNLEVMNYKEHSRMHGIKQWQNKKKLSLLNIQFIIKHKEINYKILAKKFNICPTYTYEVRRRFDENGFLKCR